MDNPTVEYIIDKGDNLIGIKIFKVIFEETETKQIRLNLFPISLEFATSWLYLKIGITLFGKLSTSINIYYNEKLQRN